MIVIKIELWPFGMESRKKSLGLGTITNDGTGTHGIGNYEIKLTKTNSNQLWKEGDIKNFKRQKGGAWDLLLKGLDTILGDRQKNLFK